LSNNYFLTREVIINYDEADLQERLKYVESMSTDFNAAQASLEKLDLAELSRDVRPSFANILSL